MVFQFHDSRIYTFKYVYDDDKIIMDIDFVEVQNIVNFSSQRGLLEFSNVKSIEFKFDDIDHSDLDICDVIFFVKGNLVHLFNSNENYTDIEIRFILCNDNYIDIKSSLIQFKSQFL
jgi:hypothetical protein